MGCLLCGASPFVVAVRRLVSGVFPETRVGAGQLGQQTLSGPQIFPKRHSLAVLRGGVMLR